MSLLFGILIAVGRLSSDSELIAMRSSGISLLTLYRPILMLSALFTLLNTGLMVYALPWGNHALQELRLEVATQTVSQQVQPRVFYEEWEGKVVYVFETPQGEKRWKGVFLAESLPTGQNNQITTADWGEVRVDRPARQVVLRLYNAIRHKVDLNCSRPLRDQPAQAARPVLDDQFTTGQKAKIAASKGIRELTLQELRDLAGRPAASSSSATSRGSRSTRSSRSPSPAWSSASSPCRWGSTTAAAARPRASPCRSASSIVYYILLNNGEEAARFGKIPAWLAMWSPNILLAMLGVFLLIRRNRDKSLLLSRVDRWVREDVWGGMLRLKGLPPGTAPGAAEGAAAARGEARALRRSRHAPRVAAPGAPPPPPADRLPEPPRPLCGAKLFALGLPAGGALRASPSFIIFDLSENFDEILKNKVATAWCSNYYKYLSLQMFYEIAPIVILVTTLHDLQPAGAHERDHRLQGAGREPLPAGPAGAGLGAAGDPLLRLPGVVGAAGIEREGGEAQGPDPRQGDRPHLPAGRPAVAVRPGAVHLQLPPLRPAAAASSGCRSSTSTIGHRLTRRLFTENAQLHRRRLGVLQRLGPLVQGRGGDAATQRFKEPKIVRYPETPAYFDSEIRPPEQMRYGELKDYIEELKESGQSVPELQVELEDKIALPVASLIMSLVALPFAFRLGRQGALYGIGVSLVLGMAFLAIYAFFTKLGEAGRPAADVAVWSPAAVFSLLSGYLFLGVRT